MSSMTWVGDGFDAEAFEAERGGMGREMRGVVLKGCRDQLWPAVCSFGNELCDPAHRCVIPPDLPLGE